MKLRRLPAFGAAIILTAALACAALAGCGGASEPDAAPEAGTAAETAAAEDDWDTIRYDGSDWRPNRALTTVLFLGIDSRAVVEANEHIGEGGRADTILLFILDDSDGTMQLLQISRDTMTEVDIYNNDRELISQGVWHLNMQYAFGDSAARSCTVMKRTVSELLYGIGIDDYCSLTLEGMGAIVDEMGGITVTLDEDWTDIDPSYTEGATVTMDREAVERFVRYRDTEVFASNDSRMDRQAWFLRELFRQMSAQGGERLVDLYEAAGDELCTDMDADTIRSLARYTLDEEVLSLPGRNMEGERHDEFYVDEEALRAFIIETFYVRED